jgi:hypothetical protein
MAYTLKDVDDDDDDDDDDDELTNQLHGAQSFSRS